MGEFLAVVLAGAVGYLVGWTVRRNRAQVWRRAADAVGLQEITTEAMLGWDSELRGTAGELKVRLSSYSRGKSEHGTRITIDGLGHGPYELSLRREGLATAFEKAFGESELTLGDPAFDECAYIQGSPPLLIALFDAPTRQRLRDLLEGRVAMEDRTTELLNLRVHLAGGELRVEVQERMLSHTRERLPALLRDLLELGRRLNRPADLAGRLAANLAREPVPGVRLTILKTLAAEFRERPVALDALRAACRDPDPAVRLHAAGELAGEADDVLLALAAEDVPEPHAVAAISALAGRLAPERAMAILGRSLERGRAAVARACMAAVAVPGFDAALEVLQRIVTGGDAWLAAVAADSLGVIGSDAAEPALSTALRHASAAVRVAAARALGRCGSATAVVPLREAAAGHPLDGELRRATRQAIAEIQSRVPGASPGQLSLAEATAGQLSLAEEDRRGELSLARDCEQER